MIYLRRIVPRRGGHHPGRDTEAWRHSMLFHVTCPSCSTAFEVDPARPKHPRGGESRPCERCGRAYWLTQSMANRGRRYCSRACYAASMVIPLVDRFWARVSKSEEPDGCWLWTGTMDRTTGYGVIGLPREGVPAKIRKSRTVGAHRVSWEIHYGPIPPGLFICHDCDRTYPAGSTDYRRCVRPDHLFLGTHADNVRDMHAKGRAFGGQTHPQAKLTAAQVGDIRRLRDEGGFGVRALAETFGVSHDTIRNILLGKVWKHI